MSWLKGLFGGKSDGSQSLAPLTDREYEQLFLQVLQGVAANWDEQRLLKLLGDCYGDRQMVVWLRGYGDRLLSEPANLVLAWRLVRLGDIGCGELGMLAKEIGLEMRIKPVDRVTSEIKTKQVQSVNSITNEIKTIQVTEGQNSEAEVLYQKGFLELQMGKYHEALDYFDRAININLDYDEAWHRRGCLLCDDLGRYEEAIASFDRAIQINPDYDKFWDNKGVALSKAGRHEEALSCYDRAITINPDNYKSLYKKGSSLLYLERYEEALEYYNRGISINTDYVDIWNSKGFSLHNLGRYEEALESYNRAIIIDPDHYFALGNKANSLYSLMRYEESIEFYDRLLALQKGDYWKAWINRSSSALQSDCIGKELRLKVFGQFLPLEMQNPALDQRGYKGQLACCNEGLKYINKETEPEGWGQLHKAIGKAHYSHSKTQPNPFPFWHKAIISYENALKSLTPKFETAHLETLQEYIRVLLVLRETEKAEGLLRKGADFLEARLNQKSGRIRELFERKFRAYFNELTVSLYIQQGKQTEALEIAEKDKNAFLRDGLLANTTEPSPDYSQMCAFLNQKPNTAIIYWHLSDNTLTTFILAPNASSEITLNLLPTPTTENATLTQRNQLTDWMTAWQNDYADYGGKKTKSEPQETKPQPKGENHPWRVQMEERLATLKTILRITDIETALADSLHCTQLLLIPHRDLHLYPLDSLFDPKYTIAYLPNIQVGIKLLNQPKPNYKRLLSIENPDSSITLEDGTKQNLPKLTAAEAESELICRIYGESTRRAKAETTLAEVTAQLTASTPQPHTIFHFTGHGYYDFFSPINSALALSGSDRLTLKAIGKLDLSSYQLACLCACETAIAGNQTITKEYIGIVSAFMYSGVANVVSTLWTVESISSALLMIEFHRRYVAGESANVALAAAKHWLSNATNQDLSSWYQQQIDNLPDDHSLIVLLSRHRNKLSTMEPQPYKHPYFWAAFTLTGL